MLHLSASGLEFSMDAFLRIGNVLLRPSTHGFEQFRTALQRFLAGCLLLSVDLGSSLAQRFLVLLHLLFRGCLNRGGFLTSSVDPRLTLGHRLLYGCEKGPAEEDIEQ